MGKEVARNRLAGITRPSYRRTAPANPAHHGVPSVRSEIRYRVVGPDGRVKQHGVLYENIFVTGGLDRLAEMIATGGEASNRWVNGIGIGTDGTAATSTDTALLGETTIKTIPNVNVAKAGARQVQWTVTFNSNEPSGSFTVKEVGLFFSDATAKVLIARRDLAPNEQVVKGDSDTQYWTYQCEFTTA